VKEAGSEKLAAARAEYAAQLKELKDLYRSYQKLAARPKERLLSAFPRLSQSGHEGSHQAMLERIREFMKGRQDEE